MQVGEVSQMWRFPVKSMRGNRVAAAELTERWGIPGDRGWVVRDDEDRDIRSAKKLRSLLQFRARYLAEPHADSTPKLEITFPDGSNMYSDDPRIHAALSEATGRAVSLWPRNPTADPRWTYFDALPLSLATTSALHSLQRNIPGSQVDPRRFRKNLIVRSEPSGSKHPEADWIGRHLRLGDAVCEVVTDVPRCVMVTLPQADLPQDRAILRTLARENGSVLGVYLRVVTPGPVREGDPVRLL